MAAGRWQAAGDSAHIAYRVSQAAFHAPLNGIRDRPSAIRHQPFANMNDLEELWAALLSKDGALIRKAWEGLSGDEAAAVRAHLERMETGEDYSAVQREAAGVALAVIRSAQQ
jgi:hypothetical protein